MDCSSLEKRPVGFLHLNVIHEALKVTFIQCQIHYVLFLTCLFLGWKKTLTPTLYHEKIRSYSSFFLCACNILYIPSNMLQLVNCCTRGGAKSKIICIMCILKGCVDYTYFADAKT